MTRVLRLVMALTGLVVWTGMTSAKVVHFADQARDPGVKRWIWYQDIGPRNSPPVIVYLSTQHFETYIGEELVVLPPPMYDIISSYTQQRVARSDCPGDTALGNDWHTVQIAERDKDYTRQCVLPKRAACDYLSGAVNLRGIQWTATELQPMIGFMTQIGCKISADERSRVGLSK